MLLENAVTSVLFRAWHRASRRRLAPGPVPSHDQPLFFLPPFSTSFSHFLSVSFCRSSARLHLLGNNIKVTRSSLPSLGSDRSAVSRPHPRCRLSASSCVVFFTCWSRRLPSALLRAGSTRSTRASLARGEHNLLLLSF